MKFLADEMMGDVISWMRLVGYDTTYAKDYEKKYHAQPDNISVQDLDLIAECFHDHRILLTRDKEMAKIMKIKYNNHRHENPRIWKDFDLSAASHIPVLYLENIESIPRLQAIRTHFHLTFKFDPNSARCAHCNTELREIVDITPYLQKIPPNAQLHHRKFWICQNPDCAQIYWIGAHFKDILKKISSINTISSLSPNKN